MHFLTISQLARKAEVNIQTIYYYEKRGLILSPGRTLNGHRRFPQETIHRILFIRKAKSYGFTLKETSELGRYFWKAGKDCLKAKKRIKDKIETLKNTARVFAKNAECLERLLELCGNNCGRQSCPLLECFTKNVVFKP